MQPLPTCILADDHAVVRHALRLRIEDMGVVDVIGEASHCPGAVELIRRVDPTLALVDLRMPGGTGLDVVRDLRDGGSTALLIVFSACADAAVAASAQAAGADAFISKDIPGHAFQSAIKTVLAGSPFMTMTADPGTGSRTVAA